VVRWRPARAIAWVADSSVAALELLDKVQPLRRGSVMTRRRLAAALSAPPPRRVPGTLGQPRRTGQRRPPREAGLADDKTPGPPRRVAQWEGAGPREVAGATATAVGYHTGHPPGAIRWVLIRAPPEPCKPQALLSTTLAHTPAPRRPWFVRRWTMAVT